MNFAPTTVLTKSGIVPISTARQSSSRVAAPVSTTRPINTVAPKPIVNVAKTRQNAFQKIHSLSRRPFQQQTTVKNRYLVNTAKVKSINIVYTTKGKSVTSDVGKQGSNVVKSSAYWVWRPKIKVQDHVSKNSGSYICKRFDYVDPEGKLKVLVTKPHNKTPYELLIGISPIISFMRPFGCLVTNLNTLDHLGKFDGKADEGFLVGYSINSKAFRVYNSITKKVEENVHVNFLKNKTNVAGSGLECPFDIDSLTNLMNYQPVSAGNRTNGIAGSKIHSDVEQEGKEKVYDQEYILLPAAVDKFFG
nr:retrovirus-related Pol polyprotein from transposon TNT 1-94 [Tanacetum cinerariifolium]